MLSGHRALAALLLIPVAACSDPETVETEETDAGALECGRGKKARFGQCFCIDDTGCPAGQYCDPITGSCLPEPVKPPPDAGAVKCSNGARRCKPVSSARPDAGTPLDGAVPDPQEAVQECREQEWQDVEPCPPGGYCTAAKVGYFCAECVNGHSRCQEGSSTVLETCTEDLRWVAATCPDDPVTGQPAKCEEGRCKVCEEGAVRCSPDGKSTETCESDGMSWVTRYCPVTGRCEVSAGNDAGLAEAHCVDPECMPGDRRCKTDSATAVEICRDDGSGYDERDCRTLDEHATPAAVCQDADCYDPCGQAARESSYFGCEYWAAVTANDPGTTPIATAAFTGNATYGTQPDTTSEFAVVVANPSTTQAARVKVTRLVGGVERVSPSSPAADAQGYINVPPANLTTIRLPWQMISGTGQKPFAFRLTSSIPVTVYQFNPVTSRVGTNYSYTNDASLLLPAHILSNQYVVIAQEHVTVVRGISSSPLPGMMAVIATQDDTQVTIKFASATLSGGTISAQLPNSVATYTLNRFDVLQFLSTTAGAGHCVNTPEYASAGVTQICRWPSDPTGSIVSSDKPVAVFGGAECTFKPFNRYACDHVEEQMMPFETWGKSYVGAKSVAYKDGQGNPVSQPSPDYWRVVAGCGKASCPAGTRVTINPGPATVVQSQYCTGNVCTLPPIDPGSSTKTAAWLEFAHAGDFTVAADQPIMLAQYLTGEDANPDSEEGDPSLILTPPTEQWRTSYHVLTSPTLAHNYLSIIAQSSSASLKVDDKLVSVTPVQAPGGHWIFRVPVSGGAHKITASTKVGVTIYGYDSYVSYGYTGGLDLMKITEIVPGG